MKNSSVREEIEEKYSKNLAEYPELLRKLLFYRGIKTAEEAREFLNPDFSGNHNPFLMKDMDKAVERVFSAIEKKEKIVIYSDYDADGIPGAVVLHDLFKKISDNLSAQGGPTFSWKSYIPHRVLEGFGLNDEAVDQFAKEKVDLIITIDCGIADIEEAKKIKKLGIGLIITDHHLPKEELPEAVAVLDPKRADCKYPDKNICGAGVIFKFVQAFLQKYGERYGVKLGWEKWLLDMVGIATVSDMVPLVGENRLFAYYGLKVLRKSPRPGIQKLLSILKIDQKNITEDDIGFMISPRINAASRMGEPEDAFILLSTKDEVEADKMARHLDKINSERKGIVAQMVKEIRKHWNEKDPEKKRRVLVAGNPDWKPSLLGLVANSLLDDHNGPVFLWGREEGRTLKGSCRSDGCVDIVEMMKDTAHLFDEYGGHSASGGFSVAFEKIDLLADGLELAYEKLSIKSDSLKEIIADLVLDIDNVNYDLEKELARLAPFGMNNTKPIFAFQKVEIFGVRIFGKNNEHLELLFKNKKGGKVSAIGFFTKPEDFGTKIAVGEKVDLLANIEKSTFRGRAEIRLRIVDIF
ncbi:MAG: single-stranded-DNA-specific exonuclease RecJ [Candidatus Paceibacterota bacterium]|jgi:single-stranded-DNA-specific exonuclease